MKRFALLITILLAARASGQGPSKRIGEIEFFGYAGIDLNKVRSSLPFREGDEFKIETAEEKVSQAFEAAKQVTGYRPTDISPTCCDDQKNWIIYVGLAGKTMSYNARPKGTARLPNGISQLYERFMNSTMQEVQKGAAAEDRSKGYALSEDPSLRAMQLEMRTYAVEHEVLLREVLATSADDQQRIVAAEVLGYAHQSKPQIKALAHANRDRNSAVRNNATRALMVLAESNAKLAMEIPTEGFVELLLSGTWTDLNKASVLLAAITRNRKAELLIQLRMKDVLERLIEMARWRTGHAQAAQYVLGRIAGIDEERLEELVTTRKVELIINRLQSNKESGAQPYRFQRHPSGKNRRDTPNSSDLRMQVCRCSLKFRTAEQPS